jgi:hypothetical protein
VIDGGNAYAAKRSAQNAADAGALAGAQYMCQHMADDLNLVENTRLTANYYAVLNEAVDPAEVSINPAAATVVVTATVTRDTFFAGVIGYDSVSPRAVAEAACRNPGAGVLPVAWSCRANAEEGVIIPGEEGCEMNPLEDPDNDPSRYNADNLYILMDSVKVKKDKLNDPKCDPEKVDPLPEECLMDTSDIVCYDQYTPEQIAAGNCVVPSDYIGEQIDCDINNDCTDELKTGGARAWLDLAGGNGGGAADLVDWITDPSTVPEINCHDWLPSIVAVSTSVFKAATNLVGQDVVLPVFNNMCPTGQPDIYHELTTAELKAGTEPQELCTYTQLDNLDKTGSSVNYHIYAFTAFHVTCVQTGKNKNTQVFAEAPEAANNDKGWCNGHYAAATNCWGDPKDPACSIADNDKTIEGYFTVLDLGGYGGPGKWNNLGTFTVVLSK